MAGTVFTQLLNDELARPDYSTNNQHNLTSYSLQIDNPYINPDYYYSTDFSGYYIKVIVLILMVTLGIMLMSYLPPVIR